MVENRCTPPRGLGSFILSPIGVGHMVGPLCLALYSPMHPNLVHACLLVVTHHLSGCTTVIPARSSPFSHLLAHIKSPCLVVQIIIH